MKNIRHIGRAGGDDDKKFEFASPDARGSAERTAFHRYMPSEMRRESARAGAATARACDGDCPSLDFRAP